MGSENKVVTAIGVARLQGWIKGAEGWTRFYVAQCLLVASLQLLGLAPPADSLEKVDHQEAALPSGFRAKPRMPTVEGTSMQQ